MKTTIDLMTDDTDGTPSHLPTGATIETVHFMLDGNELVIDLSEANQAEMRTIFAKWIEKARKASAATGRHRMNGSRQPPRSRPAPVIPVIPVTGAIAPVSAAAIPAMISRPAYSTQEVREWAKARGMNVKDRGRVPVEIYDAYHAFIQAH